MRRKATVRRQHPDAEAELKLQAIQRLIRLGRQAEGQLADYQAAIQRCDYDQHQAIDYHQQGYKVSLKDVSAMCTSRREAAENGAREQREILLALGERIDAAIRDSGLTVMDLAFLDLGQDA